VRTATCVADALLVRLETAAPGVDERSVGLVGMWTVLHQQEGVRTAAHHHVHVAALAEADAVAHALLLETGSALGAGTGADQAAVVRHEACEAAVPGSVADSGTVLR
jgi:hypothetical protein